MPAESSDRFQVPSKRSKRRSVNTVIRELREQLNARKKETFCSQSSAGKFLWLCSDHISRLVAVSDSSLLGYHILDREDHRDHANDGRDAEALDEENADLHKDCDFIMENFEIRQTARDEDIEALNDGIQSGRFEGALFEQALHDAGCLKDAGVAQQLMP